MVFQAGEGAGRSGSFFFFSHDRKWIIKTMTNQEVKLYLEKLPAFGEHFMKNKNSLLAKIFGVFTVNSPFMQDVNIMLMENTMQLENVNNLRYIFDLKGSTEDRKVKGKTKPSTTLKDVNYQICFNHHARTKGLLGGSFVELSLRDKYRLQSALRADVNFLRS